MLRAPSTRILAALAAVLFFVGDTGASGLDALLFHGPSAVADPARPHVEPTSTTGHHADECLLAYRVAVGRLSPSLDDAGDPADVPSRAAPERPRTEPYRSFTGLHEQSRAPPA